MGESTGERIKASPAQQGLTLALIFGLSGQVMIDVSDEHLNWRAAIASTSMPPRLTAGGIRVTTLPS